MGEMTVPNKQYLIDIYQATTIGEIMFGCIFTEFKGGKRNKLTCIYVGLCKQYRYIGNGNIRN